MTAFDRVLQDKWRVASQVGVAALAIIIAAAAAAAAPERTAQVIWVIIGCLAAVVVLLIARTRTVVTVEGLILVRALRTERIRWADIRSIRVQASERAGVRPSIVVDASDGRQLVLPGIDPAFALFRPADEAYLASIAIELNDLRVAARLDEGD